MKKIKIALLCVIILVQNLLLAIGSKGKPASANHDHLMQMNALQYLKGTVKLVSPHIDVSMSDEEFDAFISRVKRTDDNPDILRKYFNHWRKEDVLYTQCRLPMVGGIAKEEITLKELLLTIDDNEVKKAIINKVVVHSMKREVMFIKTPRGPQGIPAYNLEVPDNKQQMIDIILKLIQS